MPDGSGPMIQSGRPSIVAGGERHATLSAALLSLDIVESVEGMARCELLFGNWGGAERAGFQHFDRKVIEFGKPFEVKLAADSLFSGRVSAITASYPEGGPPQIGVVLEDRLQDLRMARRTRCFSGKTLADVTREIANDHGLTPEVKGDGPAYPVLAQLNQSDLAFLREVARREGREVWVSANTLKAAPRQERGKSAVELAWAGSLRSFTVTADLADQRTSLTATGWDSTAKRALRHDARNTVMQTESEGRETGIAILQQRFGERPDTMAHGLATTQAEVRAFAEAGLRHLARRFVSGEGVAETSARLTVGAPLRLSGLGPLFEGRYVLTSVHHHFDSTQGLRSLFRCERCWLGQGG